MRVRVQNVPLSADDGQITRTFVLKGLDVISCTREKLRVDNKLTNCETGDRIVLVNAASLKEPLNRFVYIGKYKAKVIHKGQNEQPQIKCNKCLETGHLISSCDNDWTCILCKTPGHRKGDCPMNTTPTETSVEPPADVMEPDEDVGSKASADDTTDDECYTVQSQANPLSTKRTPPSSRTASPQKSVRRKVKPGKKPLVAAKGQQRIDQHARGVDTPPTKARSTFSLRSPPTPVELLHELFKKSRTGGDDSSNKN